jgi:hypothetical protein
MHHIACTLQLLCFLAEHIVEMIDRVGAKKVACLVTDNAANMKKARGLVEKIARFKHIIQIPYVCFCPVSLSTICTTLTIPGAHAAGA